MTGRDAIQLRCPYAITMGLELPNNLPFDEWCAIGTALGRIATGMQWMIGDWWHYGSHHYGARAHVYERFGLSFQACEDCAWVAAKFTTSRRREVLTFQHHREVAALPSAEADELLDWCTNGEARRSTRSLRKEKQRRTSEGAAAQIEETSKAEPVDLDEEAVPPQTAPTFLLESVERKEVKEKRAAMSTQLSSLLQLDPGRTVEDIIRQFRDARRVIQSLPMAQRLAAARGLLRVLDVSPEDLITGR